MELKDVLTISISALIVLVVAHLAVFFVVRTMYPPHPTPVSTPAPIIPTSIPIPEQQQVFIQPPVVKEQEQHVVIPTYETSVPVEAPREEERKGPPAPESTSIRGNSRVDNAKPQ